MRMGREAMLATMHLAHAPTCSTHTTIISIQTQEVQYKKKKTKKKKKQKKKKSHNNNVVCPIYRDGEDN